MVKFLNESKNHVVSISLDSLKNVTTKRRVRIKRLRFTRNVLMSIFNEDTKIVSEDTKKCSEDGHLW